MGTFQCPICGYNEFKNSPGNWYQCKRCLTEFKVNVEGCFREADQLINKEV